MTTWTWIWTGTRIRTTRSRRADVLPDWCRMAVGTLTAVRVPPPRSAVGPRTAARAMLAAPAVALLLAAPAAAVLALATYAGLSPAGAALLAVGVLAVGSRGLHLDGLADTADGLAASYDRSRALEVMHRGDVGPAGASTLVVVLGLQVAATAQLVGTGSAPVAVAVAVVASRAVLPLVCLRGVPPARTDGLGRSVAGSVSPRAAAAAWVLVVLASMGAGLLAGWAWWSGPAAVAAAAGAAGALLARCLSRLGGSTGDVMGACVEAALTAALLVLAVTAG